MPPLKISKGNDNKHFKKKLEDNKGFFKSCFKVLFSHVGLFLIVAAYAIIGAYALIYLEYEAEEYRFKLKKIAAKDLQDSIDYIISFSWYHNTVTHTKKEFVALMRNNLVLYHEFVVDKAKTANYDGDESSWNYDWTFAKSLLFTFTTMGAIGYGHIFPKTSNGQIFCIYYGMIGVPLLLLFLANIGDFLASSFKYIYSRLCCRLCRIRRRVTLMKPKDELVPKMLWKEDVGHEKFMPTNKVDVPIIVNLCVIFVYLMIGGVLFSTWENWTISEAAYFTFITLTTIGFGDFVPGNSFTTGGDQALVNMFKMLVTILFCILGMALVSMAINLMQEQITTKAKWMAQQLGTSNETDRSGKRYQIKKSPEGSVACTPPDRDGNHHHSILVKNANDDDSKKKTVQFA